MVGRKEKYKKKKKGSEKNQKKLCTKIKLKEGVPKEKKIQKGGKCYWEKEREKEKGRKKIQKEELSLE